MATAASKSISPLVLFAPHPPALKLLFFTELWERFSYYGMRALLVLYLTKVFGFADNEAYAIYGGYTALVYIGPLLGGLLADRILGAKRAVAFGGILIALGHFTLAMSGLAGGGDAPVHALADPSFGTLIVRDQNVMRLFYLALALIVVGEAFFKANISTLVGKLYEAGDERRDAGFTLFYMGINIGAAAATLLCGYLADRWGWGYGFGAAGFGMLLGLVVFFRGLRGLGNLGEAPQPQRLSEAFVGSLSKENAIYAGGLVLIGLAFALVQFPQLVGVLLSVIGLGAVVALIVYAMANLSAQARDRLLVALALSGFAAVFFALFEQAGSSLNLFAERNIDRTVFGIRLSTAQFQSLNPLFIMMLAPIFSRLWPALAKRGTIISTPAKFALGLALLGAGFAVLVLAGAYSGRSGAIGAIWLVLAYFLHTAGELALSPIGLSMITKLASQQLVGFAMGVWFLALAGGQYLAAQLAKLAKIPVEADGHFDRLQSLHAFINLFGLLAAIAFLAALLLVGFRGILHQRMHGAD